MFCPHCSKFILSPNEEYDLSESSEIKQLSKNLERLQKENKKLKREIKRLKERSSRLEKDFRNAPYRDEDDY